MRLISMLLTYASSDEPLKMSLMNWVVYSPSGVRTAPLSSAPVGTSSNASAQARKGPSPSPAS